LSGSSVAQASIRARSSITQTYRRNEVWVARPDLLVRDRYSDEKQISFLSECGSAYSSVWRFLSPRGTLRGFSAPTRRGAAPKATRLSVVMDWPAQREPRSSTSPSRQCGGTALMASCYWQGETGVRRRVVCSECSAHLHSVVPEGGIVRLWQERREGGRAEEGERGKRERGRLTR
jgi:hypothetical protein